jgi:hypothetical protein
MYGLWDMQDQFDYHKIDDMEVVLRLERSHIALVSDRVGVQVRLENAVATERALRGLPPQELQHYSPSRHPSSEPPLQISPGGYVQPGVGVGVTRQVAASRGRSRDSGLDASAVEGDGGGGGGGAPPALLEGDARGALSDGDDGAWVI